MASTSKSNLNENCLPSAYSIIVCTELGGYRERSGVLEEVVTGNIISGGRHKQNSLVQIPIAMLMLSF
jgi:hypothetical protein